MYKYVPVFSLLGLMVLWGCQSGPVNTQKNIELAMATVEQGLLPGLVIKGEENEGMSLEDRMAHYNVAGVSIAVLKDGAIHWAKGYGVADSAQGTMVDTNTLFQAGSISKPVAALAALRLVEEGKLDLDAPVNTYLKTWKIPAHQWSESNPVTLRHLLTHTGGLTVHGFPGYTYADTFPSIDAVLQGKGNTPAVFVDTEPGTNWRYSGGGYTIMEKVVEDVSGMPLEEYTQEYVLEPLGMTKSTYTQPLDKSFHKQASAAYDAQGQYYSGGWHNYPEQAAAGLWTTPQDLLRYAQGIQQAFAGNSFHVINQETTTAMLTKHNNDWGLGPSLMGSGDSLIFRHGGKNAGFSNVFLAFAKNEGDGLVVMTNSDQGTGLMQEVLRSASAYYGWGVAEPSQIDTVNISQTKQSAYAGDYVFSGEMKEMQGYQVKLQWEEGILKIEDPQSGEVNYLWPTSLTTFIDKNTGDQVDFSLSEQGEPNGFIFAGFYPFAKK